jgi:hypothetical protein
MRILENMQGSELLGTAEDFRWAEDFVAKNIGTGRIIYACLRPSQSQAASKGNAELCACSFTGFVIAAAIFWPATVLFLFQSVFQCFRVRKLCRNSIFIVTDREVVSAVKDYDSGAAIQMIPLNQITNVAVEQRGNCLNCCMIYQARVQTAGISDKKKWRWYRYYSSRSGTSRAFDKQFA